MISAKGREELRTLLGSGLVQDWEGADRTLKQVARLLLSQRPDLMRLYFEPAAWEAITAMEQRQAATTILALLKAAVIAENGNPPIHDASQARFYVTSGLRAYVDAAMDWYRRHPEHCPPGLKDRKPPLLQLTTDN
ncbi:hypothetical protein [Thioalkalivibrio sulfidiphilus]|uniref:hypothetical protein n=1 Tax=Thioalkalivibrio sulfidiphilus TaxID=1033854 RepID=UPI00036F213C|nr:hypothetical protein [Thioalkalivibrio sulfidiphilus]